MKQTLTLLLAAALFPLSSVSAANPSPSPTPRVIGVEANIPFPDYGTIRNFEADGDDGVWIEDSRRNWYYATFFGPCIDLPFAQTIGIDTRGTARLDKFGTIIVRGQRCAISSFVTADKPPSRKDRLKDEKTGHDAGQAAMQN